MKIMARAFVLLAACASVARAHPIHTTLTVVTQGAGDMTFNVRAFADDFSATVARFAGHKPPADSSASADDVSKYLRAHFIVRDARGNVLPLTSCGVRRANELYWLCIKVMRPASTGAGALQVSNQMLTELHPDQVNIVQVEQKGSRRTLLFTRGSAPAAIG